VKITWEQRLLKHKFGLAEREAFYADLAKFTGAGISPFAVLQDMVGRYKHRRRLKWKVKILRSAITSMRAGHPLAEGLAPFLPPEEVAMLRTGEQTGNLEQAAKQLEWATRMRREAMGMLKKSLVPAAALFAIMLGVMLFMAHTIVTQAGSMIPPEVMNKMVLAPYYFTMGRFVLDYVLFIIPTMIALMVLLALSLPRWRPTNRVRAFLDRHMIPWTFYARLQTSFAMMTLAAMMQSGVPFKRALEDLLKTAPPWLRTHLARALDRLGRGQTQIESLMDRFLPEDIEDRLTIYARLPEFDSVMDRVARDSLDTLMGKVVGIGKLVNVGMMFFMAGFLLATMGSMGEVGLSIDPKKMQQMQMQQGR
jgi:type II secretory pathway component PulF